MDPSGSWMVLEKQRDGKNAFSSSSCEVERSTQRVSSTLAIGIGNEVLLACRKLNVVTVFAAVSLYPAPPMHQPSDVFEGLYHDSRLVSQLLARWAVLRALIQGLLVEPATTTQAVERLGS